MNSQLDRLQQMISGSRKIVFFGGAGVSTESGIPDFRSANGLYRRPYSGASQTETYAPEELLSHTMYRDNPELFFAFYRSHMLYPQAKPNEAHKKLAEMEQTGICRAVVTQNIDGLHQAAGSQEVYELHGSVHRNHCERCGRQYPMEYVLHSRGIPRCACGGVVKPSVVLYEEALPEEAVHGALEAITQADMLIVAGTSLSVYPASGFVHYFSGAHLVIINQTPTPLDQEADLVIQGAVGETLKQIRLEEIKKHPS